MAFYSTCYQCRLVFKHDEVVKNGDDNICPQCAHANARAVAAAPYRDLFGGKTVDVALVDGLEGPHIQINEYRICGPNTWGGGRVLKKWKAKTEDILRALGIN